MSDFVTVATFTLPTEVIVYRGRLESEGIPCRVLNELTAQVNNFYSNAIGGVQLQVKSEDVPRTLEILRDAGYPISQPRPVSTLVFLDRVTAKIPLLNQMPVVYRSMVILSLVVLIPFFTILALNSKPDLGDVLRQYTWHLKSVQSRNGDRVFETLQPNSPRLKMEPVGQNDVIQFTEKRFTLLSQDYVSMSCNYFLVDDSMFLFNTTSREIIEPFAVEFQNPELILKSPLRTIVASRY